MAHSGKTQTQVQKQGQDELMYIVREDTLNFIGILFEALAVYDYFKDPQHQMCQTFKNRLITQINLSNGIYFEQRENGQEINQLKLDAADKIKKVLSTVQFDSGRFKDLIDLHLNKNLLKMNGIDQIKGNFDQQPTKLSDANVQKIVNAMDHQDQQFNKLSKGQMKCQLVSQIELQTQAQTKYASALQQLEKNFNQQGNAPRDRQIKTQIQNGNYTNNIGSYNTNTNTNNNNYNNKQDEKLPYKLTLSLAQCWMDNSENQKAKLKDIFKVIQKDQQQNIINILNKEIQQKKDSKQVKALLEAIQMLQQEKDFKLPDLQTKPWQKFDSFISDLQKQSQ